MVSCLSARLFLSGFGSGVLSSFLICKLFFQKKKSAVQYLLDKLMDLVVLSPVIGYNVYNHLSTQEFNCKYLKEINNMFGFYNKFLKEQLDSLKEMMKPPPQPIMVLPPKYEEETLLKQKVATPVISS